MLQMLIVVFFEFGDYGFFPPFSAFICGIYFSHWSFNTLSRKEGDKNWSLPVPHTFHLLWSLNFCLSWKLVTVPSNLKESLAGYSILGRRFFPFITLNVWCHSHWLVEFLLRNQLIAWEEFPCMLFVVLIFYLCLYFLSVWLLCVSVCI